MTNYNNINSFDEDKVRLKNIITQSNNDNFQQYIYIFDEIKDKH